VIRLVPASLIHVGPIATRMRAADTEEVKAFGRTPKDALRIGLMVEDRPEGMMGMVPVNLLDRIGAPWMLGTDELYRHPRAWLELMPKVVSRWGDSTKHLSNLIGRTNTRAIRMLRRCKFAIGEEVTVIGGVDFVTFSMAV
jgi:hypothetical protein